MAPKKKPDADPAATTETGLDTGQRKPLEDLGDIKAEINQGAPDDQGKKPKKRGPYKKKAKQPEPEPEPIENPFDKQAIAAVYNMVCNKAAARPGHEHWRLEPHESDMLATTTLAMVDKYLPKLGPWMVEINFGIALTIVFGNKFMTSYEITQLEKAKKAEEEKPKNAIAE